MKEVYLHIMPRQFCCCNVACLSALHPCLAVQTNCSTQGNVWRLLPLLLLGPACSPCRLNHRAALASSRWQFARMILLHTASLYWPATGTMHLQACNSWTEQQSSLSLVFSYSHVATKLQLRKQGDNVDNHGYPHTDHRLPEKDLIEVTDISNIQLAVLLSPMDACCWCRAANAQCLSSVQEVLRSS
jgi:hypothetical protein